MRRSALTVLLTGSCLWLFATVASGAKPVREPLPSPPDTTFDAGQTCDFPVTVETLTNKEFITTFSDGRTRITGALKVRLTNADDPDKSLIVNASGPGWQSETETSLSISGQGRWLLFQFPGDEPGPGIFLYRGQIHIEAGEHLVVVSSSSPPRDLCADLA